MIAMLPTVKRPPREKKRPTTAQSALTSRAGPRALVNTADLRAQASESLQAITAGYDAAQTAIGEIQKLLVNAQYRADDTSGRTASQEVATLTKALKDCMSVLVGARTEARATLDALTVSPSESSEVDPPRPAVDGAEGKVTPARIFSSSRIHSDVGLAPTSLTLEQDDE